MVLIYRIESSKEYNQKLYDEIYAEYDNVYDNTNVVSKVEDLNNRAKKYLQNENIIGEIRIDKINLKLPILYETTEELLKIAPTKYSGQAINGIGNLVIIGHNYYDGTHFSNLNNLSIGDEVILTDLNKKSCTYEVFDKEIISPKDFSCLAEDKNNLKSFVTLITCINGVDNRLVVKCVEK